MGTHGQLCLQSWVSQGTLALSSPFTLQSLSLPSGPPFLNSFLGNIQTNECSYFQVCSRRMNFKPPHLKKRRDQEMSGRLAAWSQTRVPGSERNQGNRWACCFELNRPSIRCAFPGGGRWGHLLVHLRSLTLQVSSTLP